MEDIHVRLRDVHSKREQRSIRRQFLQLRKQETPLRIPKHLKESKFRRQQPIELWEEDEWGPEMMLWVEEWCKKLDRDYECF